MRGLELARFEDGDQVVELIPVQVDLSPEPVPVVFIARLVLKGGTALNLFLFDLPRLSVDIDVNYIGSADRDVMLEERPTVDRAEDTGSHIGPVGRRRKVARILVRPNLLGEQRGD